MSIPEDGAEIFKAVVNSHNAQLEYIRKLEAVVEAAEAAIDEADPRHYRDLTPKMQELAVRLKALKEVTG